MAAFVILAGLGAVALVAAPLFGSPAAGWATIEQKLVPAVDANGHHYRVVSVARDASGAPVALPADLPTWSFGSSGSLERPETVDWSRCEAPPECAFTLARDDIVYFTPADPAEGLVRAYDPRKEMSLLDVAGAWSRFADTQEGLRIVLIR